MSNKFIDTAISYLGTIEGDSKHHEIVDIYNTISPLPRGYSATYNDSWCMIFVSAIAKLCEISNTEFPYECSCQKAYNNATDLGLTTDTIRTGNLIFYDWNNNDTLDHVGIITCITNDILTVIEGNKSDSVAYRQISKNSSYIKGYVTVPIISTDGTITDDEIIAIAYDVIAGKYGNGETRKNLLGDLYETVQTKVNEILNS